MNYSKYEIKNNHYKIQKNKEIIYLKKMKYKKMKLMNSKDKKNSNTWKMKV